MNAGCERLSGVDLSVGRVRSLAVTVQAWAVFGGRQAMGNTVSVGLNVSDRCRQRLGSVPKAGGMKLRRCGWSMWVGWPVSAEVEIETNGARDV